MSWGSLTTLVLVSRDCADTPVPPAVQSASKNKAVRAWPRTKLVDMKCFMNNHADKVAEVLLSLFEFVRNAIVFNQALVFLMMHEGHPMHSQKRVSCARFWITDLTIRGVIIFQ